MNTHRPTTSSKLVLSLLILLTAFEVTDSFSPNPLILHKTHRISTLWRSNGNGIQPIARSFHLGSLPKQQQEEAIIHNKRPWFRISQWKNQWKNPRFPTRIQRILPVLVSVLFLVPKLAMASDISAPLPPAATMMSPVPPGLEFQLTLRLAIAALLGAGLGKERSFAKHSAGVRTMALVAMGASAFTVCSLYGFNVFGAKHDPGRMASQVASGVGFVGAGVITSTSHLNGRNIVHGLTTAATIWLSAAVGVACGTGMYQVGTAAAALTIFILRLGRIHPKSVPEPQSEYSNMNQQQQSRHRRFIPSELSATPLDWQHTEDDDCFAETHDTAEWDEHHHTVQKILDDEMPRVIQEARRQIEEENRRLSLQRQEEEVASKLEDHSDSNTKERIKVVEDPEIAQLMRHAMQHNHTNHQELHIQHMQRFAEMANKTTTAASQSS